MITEILFSALVMTTPLVLAGLGGLIHRSSGIVNVGLDGMMLLGALVALILASGGNWAVALVGAALSGHSVLTWIAWALVPLTAWVLTRHRAGRFCQRLRHRDRARSDKLQPAASGRSLA
jgi:ABC-type uncharacterized transport system permease subunit